MRLGTNLNTYNKFVSIILLGMFFVLPVFALNHMLDMNHDHHQIESGCVYILGQSSFCEVNLVDTVNIWKKFNLNFFQTLKLLLSVFAPIYLLYSVYTHSIDKYLFYFKKQKFLPIILLYRILLSKVIVHSKAF